jgi:hypothetical protein
MLKASSAILHKPCIAGSKAAKSLELIVARRLYVNLVEPPSCHHAIVLIGKNSHGQWVAREQNGLYGGLFVSRTAAVRYALFENGHHPEAIISAGLIELDMGTPPSPSAAIDAAGALPRRAA